VRGGGGGDVKIIVHTWQRRKKVERELLHIGRIPISERKGGVFALFTLLNFTMTLIM
jgi:hypothetical protein